MEIIVTKVLPAILGFVAGAIGSLVAPWVNWGIEKRREKRKRRQELVDSWCQYIENEFEWSSFRNTAMFSQMKPYLSEKMVKELDPVEAGEKPTIHLRSPIGEDTLTKRLLDEIAAVEKSRKTSDIDAIAGYFAIEHTSIDTLPNQRRDSDWFRKWGSSLRLTLAQN